MPISVIAQATRRLFAPILFVGVLVAAGCTPTAPAGQTIETAATPEINQRKLCSMDNPFGFGADCEPGQKVIFMPNRWGNEQLPVMFAATNCDLRYSVVLTKGAVTCIYAPLRKDEPEGGNGADDESSETSDDSPDETPSEP